MIPGRFRKRKASKVFCIGFQKTGTSSLGSALKQLGFSVCGAVGINDPLVPDNIDRIVDKYVPRHDAFEDNPWPVLYGMLDARFPDSRFVYTWREPEEWIRSVVRHFGGSSTPMREWIYGFGDPTGHESEYLDRYLGHRDEVLRYFAGERADRFLELRITAGEGWEELCSFLDVPPPLGRPFPHWNRGARSSAGTG